MESTNCDAVVLGVQIRDFFPAWQQLHTDTAAVGDELEQLCFGLTEAVDRDLCAVAALRQARRIPKTSNCRNRRSGPST